jgi:hypothetical protein
MLSHKGEKVLQARKICPRTFGKDLRAEARLIKFRVSPEGKNEWPGQFYGLADALFFSQLDQPFLLYLGHRLRGIARLEGLLVEGNHEILGEGIGYRPKGQQKVLCPCHRKGSP